MAFWPFGHATRTATLREQPWPFGLLAFWPRYANGHATRTTLAFGHATRTTPYSLLPTPYSLFPIPCSLYSI
ncbi:hypothetical protein [Moorena producens]|uniref:hypothetical protein n=1 Tax=Moorena producens TaxID=1155739 RepID=UPI0011EA6F5B|nr:hypothetical protein [Moorena producens]